ncbi:ATP-binding cassette domain-containing protein [Teredinibacter turnerae]|uniref:ABC transporter ATP-binding protein n=1 Tax=Teredinibacter turnerae TaxID=2426 RepID=UPI00037E68BA|nr:ATP-binding cassette domain-containing protein [Teredinibacter turnerae]
MIEAMQLHKSFKRKGKKGAVLAVRDLSFGAQDGAITGLLGPNGAGKSTTLRMLATLLVADSGHAIIDRIDAAIYPQEVRRTLGYLPHNSGVYPRLTARENIEYYARIAGLERSLVRSRTDKLIELLDMGEIEHRRADGFSQGQRTKIGLARALVHEPKNLLLDEPTNGLDVMATRSLRKIIRMLRDEGHCIIFSSHIMQEVAALCDHIAIISEGTIAIADTLPRILETTGQSDLEDAFVVAIGESLEAAE